MPKVPILLYSNALINIMDKLNEKCAVFGIYGPKLEAARLTYFGLYALQHRGQESSGISSTDGKVIRTHKSMGLVAQVYTEEILDTLKGHMAIGHNRYATSGGSFHFFVYFLGHYLPVRQAGLFFNYFRASQSLIMSYFSFCCRGNNRFF